MVQATATITPIRGHTAPQNPLDTAIHNAGRALCNLQMTRLVCAAAPTKSEAQDLVRDLLDIAGIVDVALLAIGREVQSHFGPSRLGRACDLELFTDQLRGALEGNATYSISQAAEYLDDEIVSEWRHRFALQAAE